MTDMPTHEVPASPWQQLVRTLVPMTMEAFAAKFDHDIHIDVRPARPDEDRPSPVFIMVCAKPGLLPTKIEREWFDGYVLGYRQCCNMVLDMLDSAANQQVPS